MLAEEFSLNMNETKLIPAQCISGGQTKPRLERASGGEMLKHCSGSGEDTTLVLLSVLGNK